MIYSGTIRQSGKKGEWRVSSWLTVSNTRKKKSRNFTRVKPDWDLLHVVDRNNCDKTEEIASIIFTAVSQAYKNPLFF